MKIDAFSIPMTLTVNSEKNQAKTKRLYLSASRIDCFLQCSQRYASRYIWKLPDAGNDGSRRGSVCHEVFELLQKPRHRKHYDNAVAAGTCQADPVLWRYISRVAARFQVADSENLEMIDEFIMVGLKHGFFGPDGTKLVEVEREFDIVVDAPNGKKYSVRGFIDRVSHVEDAYGLWLACADYKSSRSKFPDPDNIQSQVYQLALRHLYPHITRRTFEYIFLRFPRVPKQIVDPMTDPQLDGFEWQLTDIQTAMEQFTLANSADNLLAARGDYDEIRKICGREGVKKDGSPAWICPARKPLDYFVILDADGEIVTSAFTREEAEGKLPHEIESAKKKGKPATFTIEERYYPGCAFYYNSDGRPRNFN